MADSIEYAIVVILSALAVALVSFDVVMFSRIF